MALYDLGDPVTLTLSVTVAGSPVTPTTLVLTVTDPAGLVSEPPITSPGVGQYEATWTPVKAGAYSYRWVTTGAGAGAEPGTFTVGAALVTLAQAKAAVRSTSSADDAELSRLIGVVTRHLVRMYGVPMPGVQTVRGHGPTVILPLDVQVSAVTSGGTPVTGWFHDTAAGLLRDVYGPVEVTFTGLASEDVQQAALYVVQHAWESQAGAVPVPYNGGTDETFTVSRGFFVPDRAAALLRPFRTYVA